MQAVPHLPPTTNELPHRNCYRVSPQLIAGEYPGAIDVASAQAKLTLHLDAGVTCFLDLTEKGELQPYAEALAVISEARGLTVRHCRKPIRDARVPTASGMVEILDALDSAIAEGHTVYVHCWGGIGRTGTVVGCWLARHGMTGDEALATIARHWQGVEKRWRQPRSPETDEQHAFVRQWREAEKASG